MLNPSARAVTNLAFELTNGRVVSVLPAWQFHIESYGSFKKT